MLINPNTKYKRFNTRRIFKTYDNWDLSLRLIKNELGNKNEKLFNLYLCTFDLKDDERDKNGRKAVEILGIEDNSKYYTWRPKNVEQLTLYLELVNKRIENRGERMIHKLKKVLLQ